MIGSDSQPPPNLQCPTCLMHYSDETIKPGELATECSRCAMHALLLIRRDELLARIGLLRASLRRLLKAADASNCCSLACDQARDLLKEINDGNPLAQIALLQTALEPFARMATWLDAMNENGEFDNLSDDNCIFQVSGSGGSNALFVKDLRRARAVLTLKETDGGGDDTQLPGG